MSLHTWGHEYPDRYDPVICATCKDECDRGAKWLKLDDEWSWICPRCLSALNQALPGDLLNDQMEKESSDGTE